MIDVHVVNNTTLYGLHVDVVAKLVVEPRTMITVTLTQPGGDPVAKELDETKKVLGDLLQERVVGLKVYSVWYYPYPRQRSGAPMPEILNTVYLTLKEAQEAAERKSPHSAGHRIWGQDRGHRRWTDGSLFQITEHEIR